MSRKDRRYGNIRYQGFGSRKREAEVTTHPLRVKEFPKRAQRAKDNRFRIPTQNFKGLPHFARQLGPATALGDDMIVVLDFKPSKAMKNVLDNWLGSEAKTIKGRRRKTVDNVNYVISLLRKAIRKYFQYLRDEMRLKINEIVPKMTGRLRRGMIATLTKCINNVKYQPFIFKLNTLDSFGYPIFYANPVNNMPQDWLTHPPNTPATRMYKGKEYVLDDPEAQAGWYGKVLEFGRKLAKQRKGMLRVELIKQFGVTPLTDVIYQELMRNIKFK